MKGVEVTDEMMDAVGDMQMVESVTLLSGGPYNGFTCARLMCAHAMQPHCF